MAASHKASPGVRAQIMRLADAKRGKPLSAEARAKDSAACKASPLVQANILRATALAVRVTVSSIELAVRAVLDRLGVEYEIQHRIGRYFADIFIPSRGLVIECDGSYWHRDKMRDAKRDAYMVSLGYSVLRLPEREIRSGQATPRIIESIWAKEA